MNMPIAKSAFGQPAAGAAGDAARSLMLAYDSEQPPSQVVNEEVENIEFSNPENPSVKISGGATLTMANLVATKGITMATVKSYGPETAQRVAWRLGLKIS